MPNEPEEAPVISPRPEIENPGDPEIPRIPVEAPDRQPEEVPPQPKPGKGSMQDSVEAKLKVRGKE